MAPADDQAIVLPCTSVMVIIVLLNVEFTWAMPDVMFLRSRLRTRVVSLAIGQSFPVISSCRRSAWTAPCGCARSYACAEIGRAGRAGGGGPDRSRGPSAA